MSHPLDHQANAATRREEQRQAKQREAIFKADVRDVMASKAMRRVLWQFLVDTGIDQTVFRSDPAAMGHASGLQNAGRWWLDTIRACCPEIEATMRAEARKPERFDPDPDLSDEGA